MELWMKLLLRHKIYLSSNGECECERREERREKGDRARERRKRDEKRGNQLKIGREKEREAITT